MRYVILGGGGGGARRILKVGSKRGFVYLQVFSLKVHKGAFAVPFRMLSLKETKGDNGVI